MCSDRCDETSSLYFMAPDTDCASENPEPTPGAECLECQAPLSYVGHGRRPRYCSNTCRHRAWERRRAAADGTVATRVIELPRPPAKAPLDRDTVAAWLTERPGRLAAVLAALPGDHEPEKALCAALNRVRSHGRTPSVYTALESYQINVAERWQREVDERETALRRDRDSLRSELAHARSPADDDQLYTAKSAEEFMPATDPATGEMKLTRVGGKTFRVPATWPRAQARQWCRDHPDAALD